MSAHLLETIERTVRLSRGMTQDLQASIRRHCSTGAYQIIREYVRDQLALSDGTADNIRTALEVYEDLVEKYKATIDAQQVEIKSLKTVMDSFVQLASSRVDLQDLMENVSSSPPGPTASPDETSSEPPA